MKLSAPFVRVCLGGLLSFLVAMKAQGGEIPAIPIQASVGSVTDNRSTDGMNSECTVALNFTGDAAADAAQVLRVDLTQAIDAAGRDLIEKDDDRQFTREPLNSRHLSGALKAEVALRNPSRNATTIKILKGNVELFNPTEANGGVITIKDFLQHPAEPVTNAVLAKYGIQIMYLTPEAYAAKRNEIKAGQSAADAADEQKLDQSLGRPFQHMLGRMMSNSKNSIQMYVQDPDKRIVNLKFANGRGKPLKSRESWSSDDFRGTGLAAPPLPDTQLIIQLATPESVKTYPFQLENIPLP